MRIAFFNTKGGTGKTTLAFNVAKDLNMFLITNDGSTLENIYHNKVKIVKELEVYDDSKVNIVYDLGNYLFSDVTKVLEYSHIVVIPTTLDPDAITKTIRTVQKIESYCGKIIIVVNRTESQTKSKSHYIKSIAQLKELGKELFMLRKSELMPNSMFQGETILEQISTNPLTKRSATNFVMEYQNILYSIQKGT